MRTFNLHRHKPLMQTHTPQTKPDEGTQSAQTLTRSQIHAEARARGTQYIQLGAMSTMGTEPT